MIPIEIGSLFVDPILLTPVPIIGITISNITGDVVPIGGMIRDDSPFPVLLYDNFIDNLSKKDLKVTSARLSDLNNWQIEQLNGGERALLDVNELYYESKVLDVFVALTEPANDKLNSRYELKILESIFKDLSKSRARVKTMFIRDAHDLLRRIKQASIVAETGGSPGMYEFASTGLSLPILVGTMMKDPSGSNLAVPILGIEKNKETNCWFPLGGTVEDSLGEGLKPILLGDLIVDNITGNHAHCIGVKYNYDIGITEPLLSNNSKKTKKKPPLVSVDILDDEINVRKKFWKTQTKQEADIYLLGRVVQDHLLKNEQISAEMQQKNLYSLFDGNFFPPPFSNFFFFYLFQKFNKMQPIYKT